MGSAARALIRRGALAIAALAAPVLELEAQARLERAGVAAADVDLGGFVAHGLALDRGRWSAEVEHARIGLGLDGLAVRIAGARVIDRPRPGRGPRAGNGGVDEPASAHPTAWTHRLLDVPLALELHDAELVLVRPRSARLVVGRARLAARDGKLRGEASWNLDADDLGVELAGRGELELDLSQERWTAALRGPVRVGDGAEIGIEAEAAAGQAQVRARTGPGGVVARATATPGGATIEIQARGLSLAPWNELLRGLSQLRSAEFDRASVDGDLRVDLDRDRAVLTIAGAHLRDAVVRSPAISRHPVAIDDLALDGRLVRDAGGVEGALALAHGHARVRVHGRRDPTGIELHARLDPLPCQALLDSLPRGLVETLRGMELGGTVQARLDLELPDAALRAPPTDDDEAREPGVLELDLPVLRACSVVRDAPDIDVAALRGPYRHRYRADDGSLHERVLALGAEGFVPLRAVPLVAAAFATLEDARFWSHDGFDRAQMRRAFWHNLGLGRIDRGASTITQQTARTIWLGFDRSLDRKLEEAVLAWRLERSLSKQRIFELYVNVVELGPGVHGVVEAARHHFGLRPDQLSVVQAVHLASLAPAPRALSRRFAAGRIDAPWREHLVRQIRRMYLHGLISREQMSAALGAPLELLARPAPV